MKINNYFDNAATSYPKPIEVSREISYYLNDIGGPYGRSFYGRALEVSRRVESCRDLLALRLGISDSERIVFSSNATQAINTVLKGLQLTGREIWISALEHNAVTRPLKFLEETAGVKIKYLPSDNDGLVNLKKLSNTDLSGAGLIVVCHQSNVNGLIQPVAEIKAAAGDLPILLDASQSAGHIDIMADEWNIDFIAFTGHKGLLGPTGTGGLYIRSGSELMPLINGGTGSRSDSFETPGFLPDRYEAGTPNIVGIFGLFGALNAAPEAGHDRKDFLEFLNAVSDIRGLKIHAADDPGRQGEVFSITADPVSASDFGLALFHDFGIETRIGLHCAPLAHTTIGTFPGGTVRIAPSIYHTPADLERLLDALGSTAATLRLQD